MIYINPDTKELDIGNVFDHDSHCFYDWSDDLIWSLTRGLYHIDMTYKYYPILYKLYYINNQYYTPYVIRIKEDNKYKYVILMILLKINIIK
jgi:hypothetical protein